MACINFNNLITAIGLHGKPNFEEISDQDFDVIENTIHDSPIYNLDRVNCDNLIDMIREFKTSENFQRQYSIEEDHNREDIDLTRCYEYCTRINRIFGLEAIRTMTDDEFLWKFFETGRVVEDNAMCLISEMDRKGPPFPKARDGNSLGKVFVKCRKNGESQRWYFNQNEITDEEALQKANCVKNEFITLLGYIENNVDSNPDRNKRRLASIDIYDTIQERINDFQINTEFSKIPHWFTKYLIMLFPSVFYTCLSDTHNKLTLQYLNILEDNMRDEDLKNNIFVSKKIYDFLHETDFLYIYKLTGSYTWEAIHDVVTFYIDEEINEVNTIDENDEQSSGIDDIDIDNDEDIDVNFSFKNVILYGPPGTGKTRNAILYACKIVGIDDHLSYEDKVEEYKKFWLFATK